MKKELFKDIPSYEGIYQVSNLGRVKSLERTIKRTSSPMVIKNRILKQPIDYYGYNVVSLKKDNNLKTYQVHRLVAMAFLNHTPCGMTLVVDHINNIKTDNKLDNIQLITQRENVSKDKVNKDSKYTGAYKSRTLGKWFSSININGKTVHLGTFNNEIDAHNAYQNKLKEILC